MIMMNLECTDDHNTWSFELTPDKEWELAQHSLFLRDPEDEKGREMPEMKCSQCNKNHGHTVTREFTPDE